MSIDAAVNYTDSRDAVFQELGKIARKDHNVAILSCDTPSQILQRLQKELPRQFYNVGIAEQNAVGVAAGLALAGKKVFVYGITNFVTLRCLEQIRNDICGMDLPVTIIGSGTGFTYGADGLTHHITEDFAVMNSVPNIHIFGPSDYNSCATLVRMAYYLNHPCYIRFDKGPFKQKYTVSDYQPAFGAFPKELNGPDICIVSTGVMTDVALQVRDKIGVGVIDVIQIKPFIQEAFLMDLKGRGVKELVSLEESNVVGGLGSIIAQTLVKYDIPIRLTILGVPDQFMYDVGDRDYMRKACGIDFESVLSIVKRRLPDVLR